MNRLPYEILGLVADSVHKNLRTLSATKPRTSDGKPSHKSNSYQNRSVFEFQSTKENWSDNALASWWRRQRSAWPWCWSRWGCRSRASSSTSSSSPHWDKRQVDKGTTTMNSLKCSNLGRVSIVSTVQSGWSGCRPENGKKISSILGCCLVSLCFLCDIHSMHSVYLEDPPQYSRGKTIHYRKDVGER